MVWDKERIKLMVAIPTRSYMHYWFVQSLLDLVEWLRDEGYNYEVRTQGETTTYLARDLLSQQAVGNAFTHILWIDADMVFTPEHVKALFDADKPFVTGIAAARREPYTINIFKKLQPPERVEEFGDDLFEIDGVGMAFALIETTILAEMRVKYKTWYFPFLTYTEDLAFCIRAKELGYKIYAQPKALIGHIADIVVTAERYRKK